MKLKKAIALLLVLALALGLAACRKNKGDTPESPGPTNTPEYVYAAEYKELFTGTRSMYPQLFTEDGFYSTVYEKVSDEVPEGTIYNYKGQDGTYEYRLYFVGFDGKVQRLEKYAPLKPEEDLSAYADSYVSNSISSITMDEDGNLQLVENCFLRYFTGPEGMTDEDDRYWSYLEYRDEYYIRTLGPDGGEIRSARIEVPEDKYIYAYTIHPDGQGNLLVGADQAVIAIAPDGSIAYSIDTPNWVDSMVPLRDGRVGAVSYGENGMELHVIDQEKKAFGETYDLPRDAWNLIPGGGDYDFYYTSGINLFGFDLESGKTEKLLNFLSCDVDNSDLSTVTIREDGSICGVLNTWDSNYENVATELVTIRLVPYDTVPHKETLTMAVFDMDYQLRRQVIDFNRNNDQYRIEVTDYYEYSTDDDYTAGRTKLFTEIMAGNMPDMLALSGLPYTQLASKGLLADIYPMIDADPDLDRGDFFENIFSALEVNGGLYQVCSSFSLMTVIGAKAVVGDTPGWTFHDFEAALATMPEGCDPFEYYATKEDVLRSCLKMDMESFVDWTTGKCSFDSEGFINLLKFVNQFQDEFDWETYDYMYDEGTENRIAQGRQMLMRASIYSIDDVIYNDFYFGGDGTSATTTYIGYPTNTGVGNALNLMQGYAISAKCANKEGAWAFLRSFLTEEYQKGTWYMPTNRKVFEKQLAEYMEPRYQKDEEGNFLLDEDGEKIMEAIARYHLDDGTMREIFVISENQAAALRELIENTTKLYGSNENIYEIVQAEAQSYFLGQKPVEEVARLIQSKVNIYVNEQR